MPASFNKTAFYSYYDWTTPFPIPPGRGIPWTMDHLTPLTGNHPLNHEPTDRCFIDHEPPDPLTCTRGPWTTWPLGPWSTWPMTPPGTMNYLHPETTDTWQLDLPPDPRPWTTWCLWLVPFYRLWTVWSDSSSPPPPEQNDRCMWRCTWLVNIV